MVLRRILLIIACDIALLGSACGPNLESRKPQPSPPSAADGGNEADVQRPHLGAPVWSTWLEEPYSADPTYAPTNARAGHEYAFVLTLAAIKIQTSVRAGIYNHPASADLTQWLDDLIHRPEAPKSVELELLIVPDGRVFEAPSNPREHWNSIEIHLNKIRQVVNQGVNIPEEPLSELKRSGSAVPFLYATRTFKLRTRRNAPSGWASVAISVWQGGRPLDEIPAFVCVTDLADAHCDQSDLPSAFALGGMDLAGQKRPPDAALHFIDRYAGVLGVFHCETCSDSERYHTWSLNVTAAELEAALHEITDQVARASGADWDKALAVAGDRLRNVLFPKGDSDADAVVGRLGALATVTTPRGRRAPTLYVRMLPNVPSLVLAPLNLMRVSLPANQYEFLGRRVEVQTPLDWQDFAVPASCIAEWRVFVPPLPPTNYDSSDLSWNAVLTARSQVEPWVQRVKARCKDCLMQSEDDLRTWMSETPGTRSEILLTVSHHAADRLYFHDHPSLPFMAYDIGRTFPRSSVAILAGCGTGQAGASNIIRALNQHRVSAVIATSTEVNARMAGAFVDTLLHKLEDHTSDADYSLATARFETSSELYDRADGGNRPYGPRALEFLLAGNGALRVCAPQMITKR